MILSDRLIVDLLYVLENFKYECRGHAWDLPLRALERLLQPVEDGAGSLVMREPCGDLGQRGEVGPLTFPMAGMITFSSMLSSSAASYCWSYCS